MPKPNVTFGGGATRSEQTERFDLIPAEANKAMARRLGYGAVNHGENNWRKGDDKFVDATISHLYAHLIDFMENGNANEANTDAIIANAAFLCHFEKQKPFVPAHKRIVRKKR